MATTLNFKDIIDLPEWRPLAVALNASAAGCSLACDLRNNEDRHPEIFQLASATVLNAYHIKNDGWALNISPALAGTFGAGAGAVFTTMGPRGTIAAGATTSKFALTTALPAAVAAMQLSGRGDGQGFKVRLIDNGAGGSGKTEERYVVANTAGTTPLITVDSPFSFTPVSGSAYEFLSGRVYCLSAGTLAAGIWKYFDILTGTMSGNLATANLPATISTDASFVALDASYVPAAMSTADGYHGFFDQLTATAMAAGTLTGHAAAGDAAVLANEYRNFTIRIIEDTVNVTAAGQRRRISSHTAGVSPVYTLASNWTVTPSATAKYVVENNDDILLWSSNSTSTFRYDQIGNTWDTTTYAVRPAAMAAGCMSFQPFGITPDADKNTRHSYIYSFRGGATITLDLFDIAAAATGTWAGATTYAGQVTTFTTGSSLAYDPVTNSGKFAYITLNGGQHFFRFNAVTRSLNQWAQLRYAQGTAVVGDKLAISPFIDGATKLSFLYTLRNSGSEMFHIAIQR